MKSQDRKWCSIFGLLLVLQLGCESVSSDLSSSPLDSPSEEKCEFLWGQSFQSGLEFDPKVSFVTAWAGGGEGTTLWTREFLQTAIATQKIPVHYAYVIPFVASEILDLQDCNVASDDEHSLCFQGAGFMRNYQAEILARYQYYASETALEVGEATTVWLIEPDFSQYQDETQVDGPLTAEEMHEWIHEIIVTIHESLPNAVVALNVSPWLEDQESYFSQFDLSEIDFIFATGSPATKRFDDVNSHNAENGTWAYVFEVTGKPILADIGFGVTDTAASNWTEALESSLDSRLSEGVFGVNLADAENFSIPEYDLSLDKNKFPFGCE